MGGRVSRGQDNQSLIDILVESGLTLNPETERALRLVDRGSYYDVKSSGAYIDLAYKSGPLHISAPSIYFVALKNLDIQPGNHFLNIGSGTGYLSTVVGLLLGYNGVNHGIEVNDIIVSFSRQQLETFMSECDAPFERSFCPPVFLHGNILDLVAPLNQPASTNSDVFPQSSEVLIPEIIRNHSDSQLLNNSSVISSNDHISEERQGRSSEDGIEAMVDDEISGNDRLNDDDDESESDFDPTMWEDFIIGQPPVIHSDSSSPHEQNGDIPQWPVYDRIYVGAAVTSRAHLQSILRLLKIGGILVVPYRDKFLKIIRIDENRINASELMTVSFATLLPSEMDSERRVESPPKQSVPPLEQLAARLIRSLLRKAIESRHNGPPVLGRMEKIDVDEGETVTINDTNGELETTMDTIDSEEANETGEENGVLRRGRQYVSPATAQNAPMARFLHYLINHAEIGEDRPISNQSSANENSLDTTGSDEVLDVSTEEHDSSIADNEESVHDATESQQGLSPDRRVYFRSLMNHIDRAISATVTGRENNRTGNTSDTDVSVDREPTSVYRWNKKGDKYRWVPPSYTYKEEMQRILSEELHLGNALIRSVITL
ncbi:unnamed protein product [Trichobilharzia szidati]|nr:unnamed protein product [Trichobilharzia szidati]